MADTLCSLQVSSQCPEYDTALWCVKCVCYTQHVIPEHSVQLKVYFFIFIFQIGGFRSICCCVYDDTIRYLFTNALPTYPNWRVLFSCSRKQDCTILYITNIRKRQKSTCDWVCIQWKRPLPGDVDVADKLPDDLFL